MSHPLMPHSHIPIMFTSCVQFFHMVSIDVPAGVGAPPLNTTSHLTSTCSTKAVEVALVLQGCFSEILGFYIQIMYFIPPTRSD